MSSQIQLVSILGSLCILLLVTQLIRRRRLREEYALLWFGASVGLLALPFKPDIIDLAARALGIAYGPSLLLLVVIVFGFLLSMHFSIALSTLSEQNKRLAQEVALLRLEISSNAEPEGL